MAFDPVEVDLARHLRELDRRMAQDLKDEAKEAEIMGDFESPFNDFLEMVAGFNDSTSEFVESCFAKWFSERQKRQAHKGFGG